MITIGTDCSGIESPIQALKNLNVSFKHLFSSDIDKHVISSIKANYDPQIIFNDITDRNIKDVPKVDIYVCGFPCQSFSIAGHRLGFDDVRGNIFFCCLEYIKEKRPKVFILENVYGLITHDNGNTFKTIISLLEDLNIYVIDWKRLNTKDYGIPQSRRRVYIVGVLKKYKKKFEWPTPRPLIKSLREYVDENDNSKDEIMKCVVDYKYMSKIPKNSVFVDFNFCKNTYYVNSDKIAPCIIRCSKIWNVKKHRYANTKELLSLQGFPNDFKVVVSKNQIKKQIGNSISVNVLEEIFKEIFKVINF